MPGALPRGGPRRDRGGDPVHARARADAGLHRRARGRRSRRACATRWPTSAATRPQSTRSCPRTSSSTTRSRSTVPRRRTPSPSTLSASTSATASATSCCAGRRRAFAACASCHPARASSTRSTSSTWPRSSLRAPTSRGETVAFPDTLVGTDSHTTMVNGLGVLGYGVGGIEAEAVLLGQPLYQPMPRVVGVRLFGDLPRGSTATDLVLVISQHAARPRRGGLVRRVRGRRPGLAGAGRPGHDLEHVARVRRHGRALPDRRRDARLPAPDRPARASTSHWSRRTPRRTASGVSPAPGRTSTRRSSSTWRPSSRPSPARAGRRTRSACPTCRPTSASAFPQTDRPPSAGRVGDWKCRVGVDRSRRGRHRGHHLLHQHVQPDGHDRRRPAGPKRDRQGLRSSRPSRRRSRRARAR